MRTIKNLLKQRLSSNEFRKRPVFLNSDLETEIICEGKKYLSFQSNDYLGLRFHPEVVKAVKNSLDTFGVGSGSSHLLGGHSIVHQALEAELADFVGHERALVFSTGYMANLSVLSCCLAGKAEVFLDKLCHASLIDGARYSVAKLHRYPHSNLNLLKKMMLRPTDPKLSNPEKWIVSDGVFSVDGDIARIPELITIAKQNHATLIIDDAHGFGIIGKNGRGSAEYHGLSPSEIDIVVGTLSKAFGCFGAFVAADVATIEALIQFARPYIYTTALPAFMAAAARASLKIIQNETWRREKCHALIRHFRWGAAQLGLKLMPSDTPIQLLAFESVDKLQMADQLLKNGGIWAAALRAPTVQRGQERLRFTFSANHSFKSVDRLLECLACVMDSLAKH